MVVDFLEVLVSETRCYLGAPWMDPAGTVCFPATSSPAFCFQQSWLDVILLKMTIVLHKGESRGMEAGTYQQPVGKWIFVYPFLSVVDSATPNYGLQQNHCVVCFQCYSKIGHVETRIKSTGLRKTVQKHSHYMFKDRVHYFQTNNWKECFQFGEIPADRYLEVRFHFQYYEARKKRLI